MKKIKNLHIFKAGEEKFSDNYIGFINEHFDSSQHEFIIFGNKIKKEIKNDNNIQRIKYRPLQLLQLMKKMLLAEKIIFHGILVPQMAALLAAQPWVLKKVYWIVWGADLYYYKYRKHSFKNNVYEAIRKRVIKNIGNVCPLVKGDYTVAKEWYNIKGEYYKAIYGSGKYTEMIEEIIKENQKTNQPGKKVRLMVGNSATKTNNHFEAFDLLEKFKDENIEIICPLSYGDEAYAKEVRTLGRQVFKDKFTPLDTFMDKEEYINYLSQIDVGIFNMERQQGLGNIYLLLFLGKKVYLKKKTTMWEELLDMDLTVYDVEKIPEHTWKEFAEMDELTVAKNREKVRERYQAEYKVKIWEKIFDS